MKLTIHATKEYKQTSSLENELMTLSNVDYTVVEFDMITLYMLV
jgi:hypothetical protein